MSHVPPPLPPHLSAHGSPSSAPPPVPMPVQPIGYGMPPRQSGRPGILTAIGIFSIVLGALSLVLNVGMGMSTFGVMMMSRASRAIATMAVPTTPTAVVEPENANALNARERRIVATGLTKNHSLSPARRRQLDFILSEAGRRMVFGAGPSLTENVVAANISDHGTNAAANDEPAHDFFILGRGRLELFDDRAVFIPQDGTETVRTEAPDEGDDEAIDDVEADSDASPASATQPTGLTPRQVKAVIKHIDSLLAAPTNSAQKSLNPAQTKTLTERFSDGPAGFFYPSADLNGARGQVISAMSMGNGTVHINTRLGMIQVDSNGGIVTSFTQASFAKTRTSVGFGVSELAVVFSLLGCLIGAILAIYLIVAGAMVMRQHRTGGRMHKIYAWLKIPVAIAVAYVWVWMWTSFYSASSNAAIPTPAAVTSPAVLFTIIGVACLGAAYPLVLLFALRTRTVRDYYASPEPARADGWRT